MNFSVSHRLQELMALPITHDYPPICDVLIAELKSQEMLSRLTTDDPSIKLENYYHREQLPGTHQQMFARYAVWERLQSLAEILAPNTGIMIFDAFRSITTQKHIYNHYFQRFSEENPKWNKQQVDQHTRRFVSHPTDTSHYKIPLHNSGGAVDLALFDLKTGKMWDFGTEFDCMSEASRTDFFEGKFDDTLNISEQRWQTIQRNRRVFFHLMKLFDFVNYQYEWWHYDLGNCNWANIFNCEYIFNSLETEVKQHVS